MRLLYLLVLLPALALAQGYQPAKPKLPSNVSVSSIAASTSVQTPVINGPSGTVGISGTVTAIDLQKVIVPRHRFIGPRIRQAVIGGSSYVFTGPYVGNSIMQGTGSSGGSNIIPFQVGTALYNATGVGTGNGWSGRSEGVGGSTTATALAYLSDTYDSASGRPVRGAPFSDPYICILDLRNDTAQLSVAQSAMLLRLVLEHAKRKGEDAIVVIDPPNVDASGHILDTQANFGNWADAWRQVAADEGATLVDAWRAFYLLDQATPGTLANYYPAGGGVHPNDTGHAYIANLIAKAMLAPSQGHTTAYGLPTGDLDIDAVSSWTSTSGVTTTSTLTGVTTPTTSRMVQTGEGTAQGFVLSTTGQSVTFPVTVPTRWLLVTAMTGPGYTGSASVQYASVSQGTINTSGTYTREFTFLLATNLSAANGKISSATITWTSGTVAILGVTAIGENLTGYSDGAWPNATETGTWSDTTLAGGYGARSSSTVGDYVDLTWYGSTFTLLYARGVDQGEFTWATDGGSSTTTDAYLNAGATTSTLVAGQGLAEGWHTTRITIATKNASSSANTVKIGHASQFDHAPDPQVRYVPLAVGGTTMKLRDRWTRATVDRVLSGAPYINQWVPGQTTLALSGTGSALVRLER